MSSGLPGGRKALGGAGGADRGSVQVALGRVLGRRDVVEPAALRVEGRDVDHIHAGRRDGRGLRRVVERHGPGAPPAIALAQPEECLPSFEPKKALAGARGSGALGKIDPGFVAILEHRLHRSGLDIGDVDGDVVLAAVQLADRRRWPLVDPVHAEHIVLTRIAGERKPFRRSAR